MLPAQLIARFAADLAALQPPSGRIGIAVSGGPDSLALLLLAQAAMPGQIEAATIDHQLRKEGAAEAELVAAVCDTRSIPHTTVAVTVDPGNIQSEARRARYAALAGWMEQRGLAALLTAHHADDQAETLLLRLNRGSGVSGLAGVRARTVVPGTMLPLLRPLLPWRRSDLAAIVAAANIQPVQDPSNVDDRFDRARLRKALRSADWLDVGAIAASSSHLADADAALDWAAAREWDEGVTAVPMGLLYRPQAPRAVALRVLAGIVTRLDGIAPRGSATGRLFDSLVARQPMSIGRLVARVTPDGWVFTAAPQRKAPKA